MLYLSVINSLVALIGIVLMLYISFGYHSLIPKGEILRRLVQRKAPVFSFHPVLMTLVERV